MFLRIYFRIRRRLKMLLFFIIGFILGFTISSVNATTIEPLPLRQDYNDFYYSLNSPNANYQFSSINENLKNGIIQDINSNYLQTPTTNYMILEQITHPLETTTRINFTIIYFDNPLNLISNRLSNQSNLFLYSSSNIYSQAFAYTFDNTTETFDNIWTGSVTPLYQNVFNLRTQELVQDEDSQILFFRLINTNMVSDSFNIQVISSLNILDSSYNDLPFFKHNLTNLTSSPSSYGINDYVNLPSLLEITGYGSYSPPVTKTRINFSTEIDSIAFYKKDFSNIDIGDYEILHGLTLNGHFSYLDLNFNEFYDNYMNQDYYYLQDYLLQPPNYIETLSNRNNLWGVVSYSEPLYRLFPIEFNNLKVPLLKKNINYGEENNESINNTYYIEFESDQNLGYIVFNKDGEVIQTDLQDNMISFIDSDNNVIDKDLSPSVDIPVVKNNWYNQLSTSLAVFTVPIMFIFSLISYIYFALPIFIQMFFIVLFGLGVVVFILRVVI